MALAPQIGVRAQHDRGRADPRIHRRLPSGYRAGTEGPAESSPATPLFRHGADQPLDCFLIVHAYVLLHFVLLADKVGAFHSELLAQIDDEDARTRLRRQLPSNIFVQFLAGPHEVRRGVVGFL